MDRFVRQVLLGEIGEIGQARICAGTASVGGAGLAHEVAGRYAKGAGFAEIAPGEIDTNDLAPSAIIADPRARDVVAGSRAALAEIRRAIRTPSEVRS